MIFEFSDHDLDYLKSEFNDLAQAMTAIENHMETVEQQP